MFGTSRFYKAICKIAEYILLTLFSNSSKVKSTLELVLQLEIQFKGKLALSKVKIVFTFDSKLFVNDKDLQVCLFFKY